MSVVTSAADPLLQFRRTHDWLRRGMGMLGFYAEHWKETTNHPGSTRLGELGHPLAATEYRITGDLIVNVIHAAGGVEYAVLKLLAALDEDQAFYEEVSEERAEMWRAARESAPLEEPYDGRVGFAWRNRETANYEFANLLLWLKTLKERLKNTDDRRFDFGLINALAEGEPWTARIQRLYEELCNRGAFRYYLIANFQTHIAPAPHPFGTFNVVDERLVLSIPDPPQQPVNTRHELTYKGGHEARSFATSALDAVADFMDGMLAAFEDARREIERRRAAKAVT